MAGGGSDGSSCPSEATAVDSGRLTGELGGAAWAAAGEAAEGVNKLAWALTLALALAFDRGRPSPTTVIGRVPETALSAGGGAATTGSGASWRGGLLGASTGSRAAGGEGLSSGSSASSPGKAASICSGATVAVTSSIEASPCSVSSRLGYISGILSVRHHFRNTTSCFESRASDPARASSKPSMVKSGRFTPSGGSEPGGCCLLLLSSSSLLPASSVPGASCLAPSGSSAEPAFALTQPHISRVRRRAGGSTEAPLPVDRQ
mmetsp:Transcript_154651/g.281130  ORF Transcript_154651/g.281130 Transcript_154651/m.281130 type:complete len:262 (+) Transcript_154651:938-1723(+)